MAAKRRSLAAYRIREFFLRICYPRVQACAFLKQRCLTMPCTCGRLNQSCVYWPLGSSSEDRLGLEEWGERRARRHHIALWLLA